MADVFISYSHENREAARILADTIQAKGYDVWWDRELIAGDDYTDIIEETLDTAKAVIVLWSGVSRKSFWVRDEAAVGRDRNRLLPVSIDDHPPPLGFRQIHTVSLKGWDGRAEEPLEDIWHGLAGLTGKSPGVILEECPAEDANPFGAPLAEPAPKTHRMFAGVNAAPNNKSMQQILKEEKNQRGFLRTFWLTSFIISGVMALILGIYAEFTDSFNEEDDLIINIIVAFVFVGVGLMIGRGLIVWGRRLSKRKSVRYFDSTTVWVTGVTVVLTLLFGWIAMAEVEGYDTETLADTLFLAPIVAFIFLFPLCSVVSVIIGAIKGQSRTSFQDGE